MQRVLTRLSPEYCRLFAYKKAYKGGCHMHPRTPPPLATPLVQYVVWSLVGEFSEHDVIFSR